MFSVYNIEIQKVYSAEKMPPTRFNVVDHKTNGVALEVLIEYRSHGDPEVEALWDEKNDKFYLVGGKVDPPKQTKTKKLLSVTAAKVNRAWISIDLSQLEKKGEINILKRMPETRFYQGPELPSVKLSEANDAVLMKVLL